MTTKLLHNLDKGVQLILVTLLLGSCFAIDRSLFNGIITTKGLWLQAVSVVVIAFVAAKVLLIKRLQITRIDVLVTLLVLWMIVRDGFNNLPHANTSVYVLSIVLFYSLYLSFRLLGNDIRLMKGIVTIYLVVVVVQAVIGLLQLYGVLSSYHALFKITGTFHNPGPFSGFVVSGLPMAVGLYLGTRRKEKREGKSELSVGSDQCSVIGDKSSVISGH